MKSIPNVYLNINSAKMTVTALGKAEESVVKDSPCNLVTHFKYLDSEVADTETIEEILVITLIEI